MGKKNIKKGKVNDRLLNQRVQVRGGTRVPEGENRGKGTSGESLSPPEKRKKKKEEKKKIGCFWGPRERNFR